MADERTRYSDAELEEFKQLILKKLENARADYELLRATITHTADNDTEDTSPTFKVLEEGAATLSKEESGRLAAHQMKFIRNLEMALVRIENKTYGICKTTGSRFLAYFSRKVIIFEKTHPFSNLAVIKLLGFCFVHIIHPIGI